MNIYPQICFVYKWTQLSTNKWYIGSHYSENAHPADGYLCTSKIVKPMIRENPSDWVRIILETGSAEEMVLLECELLTCLNAAKSKYSYNRHNGGTKFTFAGPHTDSAKIRTESHRNNMRIGNVGRINGHSGMKRSNLSCSNISQGKLGCTYKQNKVQCPHCFKIGGTANMHRYHFDNCKVKFQLGTS